VGVRGFDKGGGKGGGRGEGRKYLENKIFPSRVLISNP